MCVLLIYCFVKSIYLLISGSGGTGIVKTTSNVHIKPTNTLGEFKSPLCLEYI